MKLQLSLIGLGLAATFGGCAQAPRGNELPLKVPIGLIEPDIPLDDPLTHEKVTLGAKLFFDARLSKDGSLSCAGCHDPRHAFSDPHRVSRGIGVNARRRNAMSVLNAGYQTSLDWDGRFSTLEEQLQGVFSPWGDMGIDLGEAVAILREDSEYRALFLRAFSREPDVQGLSRALAAYQRSLMSGGSRLDRFLFQNQQSALQEPERRGWELFIGKAGCITCHDVFHPSVNALGGGVALFTDHRFHNLGVGYSNGRMVDLGRYEVTRDPADWGAFKTPSLRNVALTAPYMHDGSLATLDEVVAFYDRGGTPNPNLSTGIQRLFLTRQERADLVALLRALTSESLD
jgi:cytochrome c peroxidase